VFAITWSVQIPTYISAHDHGLTVTNEAKVRSVGDFLRVAGAWRSPSYLVSSSGSSMAQLA
jgi:hypothetical protein